MTPDPSQSSSEDGYEREYMAGGAMLHRERVRWKQHWLLLLPLVPCLVLGVVFTTMASVPAFAIALMAAEVVLFSVLWLLFQVLRIHVTKTEVHIQYGLWGPRVPVHSIESAKVVSYDWKRFGGWGLKRAPDGTHAYTLSGSSKEVVEIAWRDGDARKKLVVSSDDPAALAAQIQRARTQQGVYRTRIAASVDEEVQQQVTREAEAEAEVEGSAESGASVRRTP